MIPLAYPLELERDVVLRTGQTIRVRPVREDDRERLLAFFTRLSPDALHARFFDLCAPERALSYSPASVDYADTFGVLAERGEEVVGVAHYFIDRDQRSSAEVALAVCDAMQGCGVGMKLLEALLMAARQRGVDRFRADVLPDNARMLELFDELGFVVERRSDSGVIRVDFPIASTERSEQMAFERSEHAAAASMQAIFAPRSIAVIGASRREGQLGNEIVRNLKSTGYRGDLVVVNPHSTDVEGIPSYPTLRDVAMPIELAVVVVPAAHVEAVLDDCIEKKVSAVVVISAGFSETGEAGRETERRLLAKARAAGLRIVGPNCMGVLNTDPDVRMHATFSRVFPPAGNVAMSSQSGALGLAVLDYARSLQIGFSTFVSVGNKADVSGNDLIQYWDSDPKTKVILLYLESFGNPRKFGEIARRVGRNKPIVAVKAGRSAAGARAAASHTGALATSDAIVDDLFRQSGVIRTETLEEMFDVASLLAKQPLPAGNRVAIVTNAGGPAILATDACEASGLQLAELSDETKQKLREFLPAAASVGNPIDMIASASAEHYGRTLQVVARDPNVDSLLVIYIPVLPTDAPETAAAIRSCAAGTTKTMLATFMSTAAAPSLDPVPQFSFPERASRALAAATRYARWRQRPAGKMVRFDDIQGPAIRRIVDRAIERGGGWLGPLEVDEILNALRIETPLLALAGSGRAAMEAAMRMEFPVALKAYGPQLLHKSDSGGVRLNLRDEYSVCVAFDEMQERLGDAMSGAVVQKMASSGVELMVGALRDRSFGAVIAAGAGGTLVEFVADISFRLTPLRDIDAEEMLQQLNVSKLLKGVRGAKPADLAAVQESLLRLSALMELCPELQEVDLNPLIATDQGAIAVDARMRVERALVEPSRRVTY